MNWNPNAVLFWAVGAGIGYLVNGWHGALAGFVVTGSLSVIASMFGK